MASMVRPERFRNSLACLALLFGSCCWTYSYYDVDQSALLTSNGVVYINDRPVTGYVFQLAANKKDTLSLVSYKEGLKDGISLTRYDNGRIKELRFYEEGRKVGKHTGFWKNGRKKFVYRFKAGVYQGQQFKWYESGRMYQMKNYNNGQEEGLQQEWNDQGTLVINYEFYKGRQYGNIGKKNCASVWRTDVYAKPLQ